MFSRASESAASPKPVRLGLRGARVCRCGLRAVVGSTGSSGLRRSHVSAAACLGDTVVPTALIYGQPSQSSLYRSWVLFASRHLIAAVGAVGLAFTGRKPVLAGVHDVLRIAQGQVVGDASEAFGSTFVGSGRAQPALATKHSAALLRQRASESAAPVSCRIDV